MLKQIVDTASKHYFKRIMTSRLITHTFGHSFTKVILEVLHSPNYITFVFERHLLQFRHYQEIINSRLETHYHTTK